MLSKSKEKYVFLIEKSLCIPRNDTTVHFNYSHYCRLDLRNLIYLSVFLLLINIEPVRG